MIPFCLCSSSFPVSLWSKEFATSKRPLKRRCVSACFVGSKIRSWSFISGSFNTSPERRPHAVLAFICKSRTNYSLKQNTHRAKKLKENNRIGHAYLNWRKWRLSTKSNTVVPSEIATRHGLTIWGHEIGTNVKEDGNIKIKTLEPIEGSLIRFQDRSRYHLIALGPKLIARFILTTNFTSKVEWVTHSMVLNFDWAFTGV